MSSNHNSACVLLMSLDFSSSNRERSGHGANATKVDSFCYVVTRLCKSHAKNEQPMFQNKECDASVGKVAFAFILGGMLNSDAADIVLYSLREKFLGTDKLIVPTWVMTMILNGYIDGNLRQWFTKSGADGYDFVLFPTFDPPELAADMKPCEDVGHWCLVILNMKIRRFGLHDSLRDETWSDTFSFFRTMTDNIKRLWRESSVDRAKPFSPVHVDDFSSVFFHVPKQKTHEYPF